MKWFLLYLLVASCTHSTPLSLSDLKQELDFAQKDLLSAKERVLLLEEEIAKQEIAKIQNEFFLAQKSDQLNSLNSRDERFAFFSEQRQILALIIKNHPSCSDQAQNLLDEILTFITKISDSAIE